MGDSNSSQFLLQTKGHCFLCLRPSTTTGEQANGGSGSSAGGGDENFSFQKMFDHLKINLGEVLKEQLAGLPQAALASFSFQKTELKGVLCGRCVPIAERILGLMRQLEEIQKQLGVAVKPVCERILEAERDCEVVQQFTSEMLASPGTIFHFGILEMLRKQTFDKCTEMSQDKNSNPAEAETVDGMSISGGGGGGGDMLALTDADNQHTSGADADQIDLGTEVRVKVERSNSTDTDPVPCTSSSLRRMTSRRSLRRGNRVAVQTGNPSANTSDEEFDPRELVRIELDTSGAEPATSFRICSLGSVDIQSMNGHDEGGENPAIPVVETVESGTEEESTSILATATGGERTRPIGCDRCGKRFHDQERLKRHQKLFHGLGAYKCHKCGAGFSENRNRLRHQKLPCFATPDGKWECASCNEKFVSAKWLSNHIRVKHSGEFKCDRCFIVFNSSKELLHHIKRQPGKCRKRREASMGMMEGSQLSTPTPTPTPKTPTSAKSSYRAELVPEEKTNPNPRSSGVFQCGQCPELFKVKSDLRSHVSERHPRLSALSKTPSRKRMRSSTSPGPASSPSKRRAERLDVNVTADDVQEEEQQGESTTTTEATDVIVNPSSVVAIATTTDEPTSSPDLPPTIPIANGNPGPEPEM